MSPSDTAKLAKAIAADNSWMRRKAEPLEDSAARARARGLLAQVEQDEESAQASATTLQAVWRGRRSRQRPNYLCTDHREHAEEKSREDVYEKGRLARSRWPSGRIDFFRGDAGQERRWKTEWPRGHSSFYKGAPGYEYRWKTLHPISLGEDAASRRPNSHHGPPFGDNSCRMLEYSAGFRDRWYGFSPNGEFRVCVENAAGERNLYVGSVASHDLATLGLNPKQVAREMQTHTIGYRGAPGKEAQCRIEMSDGMVHLYRGPRNQERRYRTEWASGNIEHFIPSETNRFDGKRVYAEWPNGRIDWFGGPEDNRACIYSMHANGCRDHYKGDAGKEVRTHRDMPDGHVQIFAMDGDQQHIKEERWPSGMRRVYTRRGGTDYTDYTEAPFAKWERSWVPACKAVCLEDAQKAMEAAWAPYVDERGQLGHGGAHERDAKKRAAEEAAQKAELDEEHAAKAREQAATAKKAKKERRRARAAAEKAEADRGAEAMRAARAAVDVVRAAEEAAQKAELDEEHAAKARAAQARAEARQRAREQAATAKKAKKERRRARAAAEKAEVDRGAEAMRVARAAVDVVRAAVRRRRARQAARAEREREEAVAAVAAVAQREREEEERARRAEVAEAQQRAWDLTKRQAAAASAAAAEASPPPPEPPQAPAKASAECVVCLDAEATHVIVPCGHICLCADCTNDLKACPLCRMPLVQTMRIYLVNN